jgi:hypothetical protein
MCESGVSKVEQRIKVFRASPLVLYLPGKRGRKIEASDLGSATVLVNAFVE